MGNRKTLQIFYMMLIIQCFVIVIWAGQKERLNVDEMFTMEGAKQDGVGMRYWDLEEGFYGREHSNEEFLEHMTVYSDELLINQGIVRIGERLIHGEFYYVMVNLAASIRPGYIPWETGAGMNLLFFLIAQIVLFQVVKGIFGGTCALYSSAIYGFSAGAISTVLYVRCYMMIVMCVLLLIYVYLKLINANRRWQKAACVLGLYFLAGISYLVHQFGMILFVIITMLFVLYILVSKKKNALFWIISGYCVPVLLMYKIVFARVKDFFASGVSTIFWGSVRSISIERTVRYIKELLCAIAGHLFANIWIMALVMSGFLFLFLWAGKRHKKLTLNEKLIVVLLTMIIIVYYTIIIAGGAISWKYFCPVYPMIAILMGVAASSVFTALEKSVMCRSAMVIVGICIVAVSYGSGQVSELFRGEKAMREEMEERYHGINGIMVHHDCTGTGENRLYEAATLWPQESNVLVIQNKVLQENCVIIGRMIKFCFGLQMTMTGKKQ